VCPRAARSRPSPSGFSPIRLPGRRRPEQPAVTTSVSTRRGRQTDETPGAVIAGYRQRLAGWRQIAFMTSPNATSIDYESPDGLRHAAVLVGTERRSGKTNINISLTGSSRGTRRTTHGVHRGRAKRSAPARRWSVRW